ncbi:BTAD domain-containing putative transcriptional regulator [Polymorphospora rubra]
MRIHREARRLTQEELAQLTGLSAAAIRDLEQGRTRRPQPRSVRALVDALGLSEAETKKFHGVIPSARRPPGRSGPGQPVAAATSQKDAAGPVMLSILGPLVVLDGTAALHIESDRARTLLGRLALTPNRTVVRDELIELLWGERVPATAVNLVQTYVSRLRRVLEPARPARGPSRALTLTPRGYQLNVTEDQLDLLRFRRLVDSTRQHTDAPESAMSQIEEALDLWYGDPLADLTDLRHHPLTISLAEEWIAATLTYAGIADAVGAPARPLPRLRALAARHPLHEPLFSRLMTALAATGNQAAALKTYEEIRHRLVRELGVDPGPELVRVRQRILRQRPAGTGSDGLPTYLPVPFQAPAPPADFIGRDAQLRRLIRALGNADAEMAVVVCAVAGVAGVGKTALVMQVAQRQWRSFPDGQLYIDLQGSGRDPVEPIDALTRFLRALGMDDRRIPKQEAECAAQLRSMLAGRRILVILDNARDAAQVRPLLPGPGSCGVLVTSRQRLADLAGAQLLDLDLFTTAEGVDLVSAIVGPDRIGGEPGAARDLVAVCGRLPIALRVAGARLAGQPGWTVADLVNRLTDEDRRLDELRVGDVAVEASLDLSYQDLSHREARAFRQLAGLPGRDFSLPAAAAALATEATDVRAALDNLATRNLIEATMSRRYRYHDLIRLYAGRRSVLADGPAGSSAAVSRLLDWYLSQVAEAVGMLYPDMVRLPDGAPCTATFDSTESALSWLDDETPGLVAAVGHAAEHGPRERAWQIADQLRGHFFTRGTGPAWLSVAQAGLAAARAAGDPQAVAAMRLTYGQALWSTGRRDGALAEYELALQLAEQVGWLSATAYLLHNIGLVHSQVGRSGPALEYYRRALAASRRADLEYVRTVTLNDLGTLCWELGRLDEAVTHLEAALALNQRAGNAQGEAVNRSNLGMVLRQMGEFAAALDHLNHARHTFEQTGVRQSEVGTLDELSQLYAQLGEHAEARATAERGLALAREGHDRRTEAALLATLGSAVLGSGSPTEAAEMLRAAYDLAREVSYPYGAAAAVIVLARATLATGDPAGAAGHARTGLSIARSGGYQSLVTEALTVLSTTEPEVVAVGAEPAGR